MNATSPPTETDDVDRLFSDFFKAQLKQPWPKAPTAGGAAPAAKSEPSELVTTRATDAPRNSPAKARDNTARARLTLAASVALVLGTGWFLADGFQPGSRSNGTIAPATNGPGMLPGSNADGKDDPRLKKIEQDKAKGPKIDFGNEE